jgi:hypothetical protein
VSWQYALVVDRTVTMHGLGSSGEQLADMPHPSRVLSAAFCSGDSLLTGAAAPRCPRCVAGAGAC